MINDIPNPELYLIESMEHTIDDTIVWWLPYSRGYTTDVDKAGLYTLDEATKICEDAGPTNERMHRRKDVLLGKVGRIARTVMKF